MDRLLTELFSEGWKISMSRCTDRSGPGGAPEDPNHPEVVNPILRLGSDVRTGRAPTLREALEDALGASGIVEDS